jgi:hypothetical protein
MKVSSNPSGNLMEVSMIGVCLMVRRASTYGLPGGASSFLTSQPDVARVQRSLLRRQVLGSVSPARTLPQHGEWLSCQRG